MALRVRLSRRAATDGPAPGRPAARLRARPCGRHALATAARRAAVPGIPARGQDAEIPAGRPAVAGGAALARLTGKSMSLGGLRQFTAAFLATGMAFAVGHLISSHVR
jgi:hypothetical protein